MSHIVATTDGISTIWPTKKLM